MQMDVSVILASTLLIRRIPVQQQTVTRRKVRRWQRGGGPKCQMTSGSALLAKDASKMKPTQSLTADPIDI
ncbi:hypothetical protein WJX73_009486 [Symbiochloris irregularis]|uniref:Uncharacterized protein n=1 Tax=Symbiochloris irregularis TaxID=706552 RepID=A0AAW1P8H1_9CHLO